MTGTVLEFGGLTRLPIDPERVLAKASGKLKSVIVIGETEDGEEYFSASDPDGSSVLWMLERAKYLLLKIVDEMSKD